MSRLQGNRMPQKNWEKMGHDWNIYIQVLTGQNTHKVSILSKLLPKKWRTHFRLYRERMVAEENFALTLARWEIKTACRFYWALFYSSACMMFHFLEISCPISSVFDHSNRDLVRVALALPLQIDCVGQTRVFSGSFSLFIHWFWFCSNHVILNVNLVTCRARSKVNSNDVKFSWKRIQPVSEGKITWFDALI